MQYRGALAAAAVAIVVAAVGATHGAGSIANIRTGRASGSGRATGRARLGPEPSPGAAGQQAPLTPEYQTIFEANLADQAAGGQGTDPTYRCIPPGMPRMMIAVQPMEIVITPETTYIMLELFTTLRRIYTDGRDWPSASSRPSRAIRSASGRTPTATAASTRSRSRPAP